MKIPNKLSEKIKYYFTVCCISFTILELVLSTLNIIIAPTSMSSNLWINNIEMFSVCLCIALIMFVTDNFTKNPHSIFARIVHLIDVSIPVFVLGGLVYHWFAIIWWDILIVFGVIVLVYFLVYGIMYLNGKITENMINKKILERKEEQKNGREDD